MTTPVFNSAATEPARRQAAAIADGHAQILRKLGKIGYAKQFGKAPDPQLVVKVYGAPTRPTTHVAPTRVKAYAKETGERSPRKLHIYTCRQWLPAHP